MNIDLVLLVRLIHSVFPDAKIYLRESERRWGPDRDLEVQVRGAFCRLPITYGMSMPTDAIAHEAVHHLTGVLLRG